MKDNGRADWRQVFALFERWQTTPAAQRDALIASIREHSPQLYPQFAAMLQADAGADAHDFMAEDALSQLATAEVEASKWNGVRLGPWVLREPLGVGGMGQVWLATRGDNLYSGRAAVKLMHMAHANADANVRFAREGEFLARLAHPRIAQLYDAGLTEDGTRYLVLEHVPGEPLDQACDRQCLGIEARLQMFLQVCEAVAFAHLQRVVHRDLKPSNILVTADGHVKLLDFGVAKIMSDAGSDIEATQVGSPWFTLDYAAPEQIESGVITTATDVFSLGVVLFRLLSGAKPLDGVRTLSDVIRKLEQPRRSMVTAFGQGDSAAIATQRATSVAKLRHELGGDLATIVAKCLKDAPSERYDTAQALGDDLRRYLAREPLRARPDSWGYRTRKFIERNRIQALAGVVVAASLLAGISVSLWQREAALQEAQRKQTVLGVLTGVFKQLTPDQTGSSQVSVAELLSRGWQQVAREAQSDPDLKAELAQPLGLLLVSMGDYAEAAEALAISRQHLRAKGATHSEDFLQVLLHLGYAQSRIGHSEQAKQHFNEVLATADQIEELRSSAPLYARLHLGLIAKSSGQLAEAKVEFERTAAAAEHQFGKNHKAYVLAQNQLELVAAEQGRVAAVESAALASTARGNPEEVWRARYEAAMRALEQGQFAAAVAQLQVVAPAMHKIYGSKHTDGIFPYLGLSLALFYSGNRDASDATMQQVFDWAKQLPEPSTRHHVGIAMARQLMRSGRRAAAAPLAQAAATFFESIPDGQRFAERAHLLQSELLLRGNQAAQAQPMLQRTHERQLHVFKGFHREMCLTVILQALATDLTEGVAAALPRYHTARDRFLEYAAEGHPDRVKAQLFLDYAAWRKEQSIEAESILRRSLRAYKQALAARADFASFDVLSNDLLSKTSPTEIHDQLFALLNY
jgi:serine/threonine-protein kinase